MTMPSSTRPAGDAPGAREYFAHGGDWAELSEEIARLGEERAVLNMGPQHPSTHGVLRLILELEGETVTEARCGLGYLHTGIEKNMEFRTWTQGVAFCTRMDYVANIHQEVAYCLAVEKLLGITDRIPERATIIRVLMSELSRAASHLIAIGTGGNELGGTTLMTLAFRGREEILNIFEAVSGLRMNNAYIRPGGVAQDFPEGTYEQIRKSAPLIIRDTRELEELLLANPLFKSRQVGIGYLDLAGCMALGVTGPILRSTGLPLDLRKDSPYLGYETYDFDVVTEDTCDAFARTKVRFGEIHQAMRIVMQCVDRLEKLGPGPVMVEDKKIAWPAQLSIGTDGQGNSPEHIKHIMGESMEALIHHFKLVTEGFTVPAGQVFQTIEHPKGVMGVHLVSDGGTRPYRAHFRDASFTNLQSIAAMMEGGTISDVVISLASIDPVLGGVDR